MKTARNHSESRRIDLYPQTKTCPQCHQPFKERYHKQRWIVKLSGELKVDRQLKKELKKKIRQIRPIEVAAQQSDKTSEAQIVLDYCLAIRTVMRTRGKYPLEFPGVELYKKLVQILDSLARSLSTRSSELLSKLHQRLSILPTYQASFALLNQALRWIRQIAHLLDTETTAAQAIPDLLNYLAQIKFIGLTQESSQEKDF